MITLVPIRFPQVHPLVRGALSALVPRFRSEESPARRTIAVGAQAAQSCELPEIALDDCDLLFKAALERLGSLLAELNTLTGEGTADAQAVWVRNGMLESVEALERLRMAMTHEAGSKPRPCVDLVAAQLATAQLRLPLAGQRRVGR